MIKKILVFAMAFMLLTSLVSASSIEITTYDNVEISGPDILLGDIAMISGDDANRINELKQLKIGNAANPGNSVVLTNELLGARLVGAGGNYSDVVWNVAQPITITTKSQTISSEMLAGLAKSYINEQLKSGADAKEYHVDGIDLPNLVIVPDGNLTFEVTLPYGIKYNVPTNAVVNIYIDKRLYNKSNVRFKVRSYEQVAVISQVLATKHILTQEDLHFEKLDTSKLSPGYITDITKVLGMETRRGLQNGTPLNIYMLEKPIIIKQLAMINIISNVNGIVVKTSGQALQDGREGNVIRVKNVSSNRIITGKVIDGSTVEVSTH
jgi:flagellar basal body P-ring formation protein FlgA